ncbi:Mut7-C RNAse domain-containing protein [Cupriavidus basilensis]
MRGEPLRTTRFVADAHLGGLAHLLRLTGFDTLYDNHFADSEIEAIAMREDASCSRATASYLKRRGVTHGCYVRAIKATPQLREIFARLDLARSARPFSLCLDCNVPLLEIGKAEVDGRVPAGVFARQERFVTCGCCQRVFWEGSHWRHMRELVDELVPGGPD